MEDEQTRIEDGDLWIYEFCPNCKEIFKYRFRRDRKTYEVDGILHWLCLGCMQYNESPYQALDHNTLLHALVAIQEKEFFDTNAAFENP